MGRNKHPPGKKQEGENNKTEKLGDRLHKMEVSICGEVDGRKENKMRNVPAKILSIFSSPETQILKFTALPLCLSVCLLQHRSKQKGCVRRSGKNMDFRLRKQTCYLLFCMYLTRQFQMHIYSVASRQREI